jgi:hypothetical protein
VKGIHIAASNATGNGSVASAPILDDEVRGHITDVLAINGLNPSHTLDLIKRRVSGATQDQLFAAAVALLREQAAQIAELEAEVDELADDNGRLEQAIEELEEATGILKSSAS